MEVLVTDVTRTNFDALLPVIRSSIASALFIAMDTELSGIGLRKDLMAASVDHRYETAAQVQRHSLIRNHFRSPRLAPCSLLEYLALLSRQQPARQQSGEVHWRCVEIITLCPWPTPRHHVRMSVSCFAVSRF